METPSASVRLLLGTHKIAFHGIQNDWAALVKRIKDDAATDLWCLQGTAARNLKLLQDTHEVFGSRGLCFASRKTSMSLKKKDFIDLLPLLIESAEQSPAIADTLPFSLPHLRRKSLAVGFALYEVSRRGLDDFGEAPLPKVHALVLGVNLDLEQVRGWGTAFQCSFLHVLFKKIWGGDKCVTQSWNCRHVFFAGTFFFQPGSPPYAMMTSASGGFRETVPLQILQAPFLCPFLSEVTEGGNRPGTDARYVCVGVAVASYAGQMQQLTGIDLADKTAADACEDLKLFCDLDSSGKYKELELMRDAAKGHWRLSKPLDTSSAQHVLLRLEWPALPPQHPPGSIVRPDFRLLVISGGIFKPEVREKEQVPEGGAMLLSSVMAGTCTGAYAEAESQHLRTLLAERGRTLELDGTQAQLGEPMITALYGPEIPILPGCYDYIFVSSFTGISVEAARSPSVEEFRDERCFPHLPLLCRLRMPPSTT